MSDIPPAGRPPAPGRDHALNKIWLSDRFELAEFASPDTGLVMLHPALFHRLEVMRGLVDAPIHITSGYRTAAHNAAVGGVKNSYHLFGRAADLVVTGIRPVDLAGFARAAGFKSSEVQVLHDHLHVEIEWSDLEP